MLSDLNRFSSALVPAKRLGRFCLCCPYGRILKRLCIYIQCRKLLGYIARPSLIIPASVGALDRAYLALTWSPWVHLSLTHCLFGVHFSYHTLLQCRLSFTLTEGNKEHNEDPHRTFSPLLIPPLPLILTVFWMFISLSLSLIVSLYIYVCPSVVWPWPVLIITLFWIKRCLLFYKIIDFEPPR